MNSICRDIFQAIHENKWLSIEYKNRQEEVTKGEGRRERQWIK